jgi:hypothetical protein
MCGVSLKVLNPDVEIAQTEGLLTKEICRPSGKKLGK